MNTENGDQVRASHGVDAGTQNQPKLFTPPPLKTPPTKVKSLRVTTRIKAGQLPNHNQTQACAR